VYNLCLWVDRKMAFTDSMAAMVMISLEHLYLRTKLYTVLSPL
jgi:hypothetical protein